jgi:carbon starvation protein
MLIDRVFDSARSVFGGQQPQVMGNTLVLRSGQGGTIAPSSSGPGKRAGAGGAGGDGKGPNKGLMTVVWVIVALIGASAFGYLALHRGETISAGWLVVAAVCTYTVAYRFYSRFLALQVFEVDDERATPAERLENHVDYVPTNKWVLYGHHFAAIAGAGPLVGPVLAAQFGFLPGTLWLIVGVVVAGAVQDFVILFASVRRDGKSLGQMAREEIGTVAGIAAMIAVLAIMVILLAVLALIVVNALRASAWGLFTIACTIPIALLMGWWMHRFRPGRVLESSIIGIALVLLAVVAGGWVADSPTLGPLFTLEGTTIVWLLVGYGFVASVLPVWILLSPRDYLSTFLKIGTIGLLSLGILFTLPEIHMPAVTRFVDGTGPVFTGKLFPFVFITIACGAVSGFHALIASGTTPKMIRRESDTQMVGYGAMLTESFVGVMALIAATILEPGVYFAINSSPGIVGSLPQAATETISSWGFVVTPEHMHELAQAMGETTLFARTGGAPSLAVGMAQIFSGMFGGTGMAVWYHFAIMFEALFILTTIDAGTRVGRFMLQELLGHVWKPLGRTSWYPSIVISSGLIVAFWGYFLYNGVIDPNGGINSLWPLFGISNQLLAAVALCVGTTIVIKMEKAKYAWTTLIPLAWLLIVTTTAVIDKVFSPVQGHGFLTIARRAQDSITNGTAADIGVAQQVIFNNRLDATLALIFLAVVYLVLVASVREWYLIVSGQKKPQLQEAAYVKTALPQP